MSDLDCSDKNMMGVIVHDNVSEIVVQKLKDYILFKNLRTGDKLPSEPQLSELLGISRSSIREAMKTLEGAGIIETMHGKGRFIREFNYDQMVENLSYNLKVHFKDFYEVVQVRKALEEVFLPIAAEKYTEADITELQNILEKLEKDINENKLEKELVDTHTLFHQRLYKVIGNRLLNSLISMFATFQRLLADMNQQSTADYMEFLEKHRKLLSALESRNREQISECLKGHFTDFDSLIH